MDIDQARDVSTERSLALGCSEEIATQFIQLVLAGINREYPHSGKIWLESEADVKTPRELHPAFYGCLDWHSSVHSHWLLVRLARCFPKAPFQMAVRAALDHSLTSPKLQQEVAYLQRHPTFECPYGWAWLLQLAAELREWSDPQAPVWKLALEPLEALLVGHFQHWLQTLELPDRTGVHSNTAFALGVAFDWTQASGHQPFADLLRQKGICLYLQDQDYPLQLEPLGYDFISPSLAEADLMRRLLTPDAFANWLLQFLPRSVLECQEWPFVSVKDPADYRQAHFRGLNLSRAWMLEGLCSALLPDHPCMEILQLVAARHRHLGLRDMTEQHYASSHWVGTFAVYLLTHRGLQP